MQGISKVIFFVSFNRIIVALRLQKMRIAYLPQHLLTEDNCTVFEEAAKAFKQVFEMRAEMEKLNLALETRTDYEIDEYMAIIE